MKINSAADLAAILDPEHQMPGWWASAGAYCCLCNRRPDDRDNNSPLSRCCLSEWKLMPAHYTGPADLHAAREHAWRMEDWLEARGILVMREYKFWRVHSGLKTTVFKYDFSPDPKVGLLKIISQDTNHTAALVAAIERVSE